MSEILTIDTSAGVQQVDRIDPLPVFDENQPLLRQRIPEYKGGFPAPALIKLSKRLKMTMKLYSGLGLSANQCGVSERIFVIGTDDFQMVCINPKVTEYGPSESGKEGCLSFPGLFLNVDRSSWINVEYLDENGVLQRTRLDGLSARCFLHELDHLNGVKFTELVKPLALRMARQKADKIVKKIIRDNKKQK